MESPPPLIWDHVKNGIKNKDMEMNSEIEVIGLLRPPPPGLEFR